jgi:phenylacetate-coenzyme A ligase PaaK-like adenylate-forming protein/Flp pilus assembly protein TadD/glycosyltransferase involved in cell wall biosynthesis
MYHKAEIKKGEALFADGQIDQAEAIFKSILKDQPDNYEVLNNLGVIHHARGNVREAEDYFLKALTVKEDYSEAILNLSDLYQNENRWEEAATKLEKCIAIDDQDPNLFNQLGLVYLEMGDTEKARIALKKSLDLNPDQDVVRESLSALKGKVEAPTIEITEKPLNILFVQEAPCIRNYKMATALRSRGHRVSLAYTKARLSQMYKGLSDDVYDENIHIANFRQIWDISKNYDIVHCHNEPDILTVAALAGDAPVVHDTHDLISLRANGDPNLSYFEGVANRGAAGRVYSTPYQLEEAKRLYGINGPSLVFYNYASEADLPHNFLPKLSDQDGNVHIVYEGGIGGNGHRDFSSLFVDLANQGIYIHIYPTFYNKDIAQHFSTFEKIHYNTPLSPKEIIEQMTQYDFGIIPFNLEKGNKRFLDSTIANKLFEYLAAGLPVIASPLETYIDYFKKTPVGITFENIQDIIENIPRLKEIAEKTDFSKQIFTYEGEIGRFEQFYREIMGQAARPEDDKRKRHFNVIKKHRIFLPTIKEIDLLESQYWDKTEILKHQELLLENLMKQAFYHVPFWKREMRYRGLKPENIQTYEDLKKLPVIDKSIMRKQVRDFIADNANQFVSYRGNTGGSTGRPFNYLISKEQAESVYYTQRRGWSWAGWNENDRLLTIAGGGLGPQGGEKIEVFGFTDEIAIRVYEDILSYAPQFFRGLPYLMDLFCSYLERLGLSENIKGKATFLTSEVLLDSQRERISKHLGEVFDTYGVNDGGSNAMECELHNGFHLSHEIFLLEILDEENNRMRMDDDGIVTSTHLYNLVMPWIRYKSDDVARITDDHCACGRTLPLIKDLKGRVTDYLRTPNAVINGTELCNMINQLPMRAYQFVQNDEKTILVKIVKESGFKKEHEEFIFNQIRNLDDTVEVKFSYVHDIPLSPAGKHKYVIARGGSIPEGTSMDINQKTLFVADEKKDHPIDHPAIAAKDEVQNDESLYDQANELIGQQDIKEAIRLLMGYVQIQSQDSNAWNLLGDCFRKVNQENDAQICWRKSLEIKADQDDIRSKLVPYVLVAGEPIARKAGPIEGPTDFKGDRPLRVFFGPREIAGNNARNAQGLSELGVDPKVVSWWSHHLKYRTDAEYVVMGSGEEHYRNLYALVLDLIDRFDVFHFSYGRSMMPDRSDVPILKKLGKKIVMQFVGCDIFARDIAYKENLGAHMCEQCHIRECSSSKKRFIAEFWEENADAIIAGPRISYLLTKPYIHIPIGVDLDYSKAFKVKESHCKNGNELVICHAPSARDIKGTKYVIEAVEALQNEGFQFSFELLEKMPNAEVRECLNASDIVVDQLLHGWYGSFAIESMSLSKPVLCYLDERLKNEYRNLAFPDVPLINANPSNIYKYLKMLINDSTVRQRVGAESRRYVEEVHDIRHITQQLKELYESLYEK